MNAIYLVLFIALVNACDQTLSVGQDVASAVSDADDNTVICLESGYYDEVDLYEIQRTGYVTLQSKTGVSASIYLQVGHSSFIKFYSLTIAGALQNSCSKNIQWLNNNVTIAITLTNSGCSGSLMTTFDGNTFGEMGVETYEGRLSLIYGAGITVTNNQFGPRGASDGIFMGGEVSNVTIGPGNVFTGIQEALCGEVHCDAIQNYGAGTGITITGNLFENGDTFLMMPDGSEGIYVSNNVFNGTLTSYPDKIQFGSAISPVFTHNTVLNVRTSFDSKDGEDASSNAIVRDNIYMTGSSIKTSGGNGCSSCTFSSNQFDTQDSASGTNTLIGTPVFVGGAMPNTYTGFALTSSSPGHAAASDGSDMGATINGTFSPTSAPSTPSATTTPTYKPTSSPTSSSTVFPSKSPTNTLHNTYQAAHYCCTN